MRTIGRTLAEIAARGEIRCNAGAWERNIAPGAGVEISNFEIVVAMGAFESAHRSCANENASLK